MPARQDLPKEFLYEEYVVKGKSERQIAKEFGYGHKLIRNNIKRHGIQVRPKLNDLKGQTFGWLTVIEFINYNIYGSSIWLCKCICGKNKEALGCNLKNGTVNNCGCKYNKKDWSKYYSNHELIPNWYWASLIRGATERNIKFELDIDYVFDIFIKQKCRCRFTGLLLCFNYKDKKLHTASLDRIDSSKGYVKDNIQWVHKHINLMKRRMSDEEFINMCRLVANNCYDTNNILLAG